MRGVGSVLVVDDDAAVATVLAALLAQAGYETHRAGDASVALRILGERPIDVVLTDLRMPGADGMTLLREISDRWRDVPVIMLTAHGSVPVAVEAMRSGAYDFLTKPFDRDEIVFAVGKALKSAARRQRKIGPPASSMEIVGGSTAIAEVHEAVRRAARSEATVLLRGESGTGKELVARAVHHESDRRGGPFIAIHCGALPDTLLESELFGHEQGAFTGAVASKPGRVELAQRGTLFLDEIGDISPAVQVKLLRFVQERRFERLGSTQTRTADVRLVAATHRDLEGMVKRGDFRSDLYFRLSVVPILLPPLRVRAGDVEILARHFASTAAKLHGRSRMELSPDAVALLARQPWPGNVRELQNFVERLVVMSDGPQIEVADLERERARDAAISGNEGADAPRVEPTAASAPAEPKLESARGTAERTALVDALHRTQNNRTLAAQLLGISRRTLYNKLDRHGIA
ncbi:MAG: sigma-54-dependent Fis family transcriptional regulator [Deltaproteobacteria bacterium]|nr:sigma-54-dependent Fis family transcriptional regulator [Deltaproteobacteria bacterium]